MLLASAEEIREQLGFDDMADIHVATVMALNAATPQIAAILDTHFGRAEVSDTFWVPAPPFVEGDHYETEFRLRTGLLSANPTVKAAKTIAELAGADAEDITASQAFDLPRGIVRDWTTKFDRQFVRITYTAGFEVDGTDPTSYKLAQVPTWLQEAAKLKALMHLAGSPALTEAGIKLDTKVLGDEFKSSIRKWIRYAPMSLLPM